jgi:hypothetical protein
LPPPGHYYAFCRQLIRDITLEITEYAFEIGHYFCRYAELSAAFAPLADIDTPFCASASAALPRRHEGRR